MSDWIGVFLGQLSQWGGNSGKVWYKTATVRYQAEETPDLAGVGGVRNLLDGFDFLSGEMPPELNTRPKFSTRD